jgi:predicted RNase H-related nuclease YkuK (DUF458 family)
MYNEEEVMKATWKTPEVKAEYSTEEVFKKMRDYVNVMGYEYNVAIGTDSQMIGHAFQFISVISVHRVGKGGLYFYSKEFIPRAKFPIENQKMRMYDEVTRSIALALTFKEKTAIDPNIHIDASPSHKKEFTAKFSEQMRGYAQSSGFTCFLKPESYTANAIADRHSKKKSRKQQRKMLRLEQHKKNAVKQNVK